MDKLAEHLDGESGQFLAVFEIAEAVGTAARELDQMRTFD
jgi:hypothetical protein